MQIDTSSPLTPDLDARIQEIGREIFKRSSETSMSLFDKGYWSGKMMEWSMNIPAFKVEMFRFVDVLPSLNTADQIAEHIRQYFLRDDLEFPAVIRAGLGVATSNWLTAKVAASSIRSNVTSMAKTFITGEDAQDAKKTLEKIWNGGACFTVDILGEAAVSEGESLDYQRRYLDLVENLARETRAWKSVAINEEHPLFAIPRANVSVKCSSLYSQIDTIGFEHSVKVVKERLRPILKAAVENGAFVNLDMEQNDYRELLLRVAEEVFSEPDFAAYPHFGIVIQAYLKCALEDLKRVAAWNRKRKAPLTIRLVKGAYWDYEVVSSKQRGWEIPVYTNKAESDANFERCAAFMIDEYPNLLPAFGSHNVRSLAFAMAYAEKKGLPKSAIEVQMLYGMAEPFKKAVTSMGYRLREYAPVGDLLPGMAYLVRRLLENTSNEGFLRAKFVSNTEAGELLRDPRARIPLKPESGATAKPAFESDPPENFTTRDGRDWIAPAFAAVRARLPMRVNPFVGGREVTGLPTLAVTNPSQKDEVVAQVGLASVRDAEEALRIGKMAEKSWGTRPVAERVALVRAVADRMRQEKRTLAALISLEVGKHLRESDADVSEAIDFCDYYALEMERLGRPQDMMSLPGEANRYVYGPRGLTVAIAPWNFPLAILCGMTVGPLVAGNPVIMKPAEQSSAIAAELYRILRAAGIPEDAVQFLPGKGEDVGAALVASPLVHVINFTGSRAVGLKILEEAARVQPGQRHIKKAVCELGGKNAILVDDDADLDEAVAGALQSAFGFQGQKCSALSRLVVHAEAYDKLKLRLVEGLKSLRMGATDDLSAKIGPVIDEESYARLQGVLERNRAKIVAQLEVPAELLGRGNFVPPTIFEESDPGSELGQNEFFGPFVTLLKAKDFDDAVRIMNDVDYALTGGIYTRSPKHLAEAKERLEVGNLYINRGITGALVGRQPFGGFKLSGVGAKAGGPDYLLQFLEPRTITENTMRRGFAPEV